MTSRNGVAAMADFTHLDGAGHARMVDVTAKQPTVRSATARARVECGAEAMAALRDGSVPKGDVFAVARIAAIAAVKRTPDLIPLAHVIGVHGCEVTIELEDGAVSIAVTASTADRTGVEMEAMTGAAVGALAIVDMVKSFDKSVAIRDVELVAKSGGKSGTWTRDPA